ncbi:MAG: histidine kinase [Sulfuricurvum sp.]
MNQGHIKFPALTELIDVIEQDKDSVLAAWMSNEDVREVLEYHKIKPDFFARHFGIKVINYAVGVVKGVNKLGNCPVIGAMLMFFNKKNIPLDDVFMICVNLKNTLIAMMLENGALTSQLFHEFSYLIDHNFSGVIREYIHLHYDQTVEHRTCLIEVSAPSQEVKAPNNTCNPMVLQDVNTSVTPAYLYLQEIDLDMGIIDELGDIEHETLDFIDLSDTINASVYEEVIVLFNDYLKVINQLMEFQELAFTLTVLIDLLNTTGFDTISEENRGVVAIYIKAIIDDLSAWRKSVFVDQNAENIHYLDQTLLSSIAQLQIMLSENDTSEFSEIEFF